MSRAQATPPTPEVPLTWGGTAAGEPVALAAEMSSMSCATNAAAQAPISCVQASPPPEPLLTQGSAAAEEFPALGAAVGRRPGAPKLLKARKQGGAAAGE